MAETSRRAVIIAIGGSAVSLMAINLSRSRPWSRSLPSGPVRTSFGTVAVLGSSRIDSAASGPHGAQGGAVAHVATARAGTTLSAEAPVASAVHGAWTAGVVVDVEVHNRLRRPVELSPGQFRVRVDRDGPTVSLYSSDWEAAPLEPGGTRSLQISYLAPPSDRRLSLLFEDTGSRGPVDLGPVGRQGSEGVAS